MNRMFSLCVSSASMSTVIMYTVEVGGRSCRNLGRVYAIHDGGACGLEIGRFVFWPHPLLDGWWCINQTNRRVLLRAIIVFGDRFYRIYIIRFLEYRYVKWLSACIWRDIGVANS